MANLFAFFVESLEFWFFGSLFECEKSGGTKKALGPASKVTTITRLPIRKLWFCASGSMEL